MAAKLDNDIQMRQVAANILQTFQLDPTNANIQSSYNAYYHYYLCAIAHKATGNLAETRRLRSLGLELPDDGCHGRLENFIRYAVLCGSPSVEDENKRQITEYLLPSDNRRRMEVHPLSAYYPV